MGDERFKNGDFGVFDGENHFTVRQIGKSGQVQYRKAGNRYEVYINGHQFGWCDTEGAVGLLVQCLVEIQKRNFGG